jgi:CubicO group peptidase (beta-lactamase class C family)
VVSKSWVEESIKPASILDKEGKPCDFYGLSWWLTQVEHQGKKHSVYYMRGVLGQYVLVIPDYNLVVVRLGEQRSSTLIGEHRTDIYKYMEAVLNMYCK